MPAQITTLIDKLDGFELVRDQIAALLLVESAGQQALAQAANKDPGLWKFRVFSERSSPWGMFTEPGQDTESIEPQLPIVNVSFESATFDASASNLVERQRADGVFQIDCFAAGFSRAGGDDKIQEAGDELAAREVHRTLRLVRNILMAGTYTYLGLRGLVARRWPQSIQVLQPPAEGRVVEHVMAARLALAVQFNESSPQVEGVPLALISVEVRRDEITGELLLAADFPQTGS